MNQPFKIFTITETDVAKITAAPDDPHHHDFEELIVGIAGRLEHFIDFKSTTIQAPFVSFVTKGKIHRVLPGTENGVCKMWVLRFKSEFIAETTFQLYAHYHDHANVALQPDSCFERLVTVCELIPGKCSKPSRIWRSSGTC